MSNGNNINIGTEESPILVPAKALEPNTPEGNEWWGKIATSSVILDSKTLGELLELTEQANSEN